MKPKLDLSVYLVLDPVLCAGIGMVETAVRAVNGGATVVQLRHKTASTSERIELGHALKSALPTTPLIMNDDIEAAIAIGADGVHIGQQDGSPAKTRARIGPDMRLGLSVESVAAAQAVDPRVVDHVGVGPVFSTATKEDHKKPIGFDGLAEIISHLTLPAVAIGGLKADHVAHVLAAGAQGVAVVSAICGRDNPTAAAQRIAAQIKRAGG